MLNKLRNRLEGEKGFTLIELLVVVLIIGILAAIAIPSFLSQRIKGQDSCAKVEARTAQTAMETYYTENDAYTDADTTALNAIEAQVPIGATGACGTGLTVAVTASTYSITSASASTNTFTIARDASGVISRTCTTPSGKKGGCKGTTW